ncbi:COX10 [[Candida] subhashii]|uniref:Protoheme IX farnesyltransferase, mitochondrial n=1 Tax=[Candida] subhashii TaxID=561895 RepID=A0A8J5UE90_9ASCO|nr:COX10 [[Candida] subhashii]KAG7660933.1 COX10 [[Candida] subhashii]
MSSRIIIGTFPRFNSVKNFNYFFQNTKSKLIIDQNFISNTHLYRSANKRSFFTSSPTKNHVKPTVSKQSHIFENVASKVLTCQEPGAQSSQGLSMDGPKLPFKITPKEPGSKQAQPTIPKTKSELKTQLTAYLKLTKPNLTVLVTLSSICSYAISPLSVTLHELIFLTLGTGLCSGAANAINMGREPEFDRQMPRTVGRPVVRGLVTPQQAYNFAALTGTLGCTMLWFGVNSTVAYLGFANIVLYAWIYTSLKRKSIINTWVGAIVGAIPPLMGWAASSPLSLPGAWCLAGLLYAWQFPHFNALSHGIAQQYKSAGYVMAASENPKLNARVALRYSLLMFPLCFGLSYYGVTDWVFQLDSAIVNGWLSYLAYQFWDQQRKNYKKGSKPTAEGLALAGVHAKKLFWCSVWHLPAVLILAMLHKKDQWNRLFNYLGLSGNKNENKDNMKLSY